MSGTTVCQAASGAGYGDPVVASVAAYSDRADGYEATHAGKMGDRVERFAGRCRSLR